MRKILFYLQEEINKIFKFNNNNTSYNFLSLLNYSQKFDNEDELLLDDFYVSLIGNLLLENQPEIVQGKTLEENTK